MKKIIKEMKAKKTYSIGDVKYIESNFLTKYDNYLTKKDIDFIFANKISYFKTMFQMLTLSFTESMFVMLLEELDEQINRIEKKEVTIKKSIKKMGFLKNNFFMEGNEVIMIVKSELGYYLIYNNRQLKVFNLTNQQNGYHIYANGNFCSGNIYSSLQGIVKKGKIYEFIMFLLNILTNYNDKKYHLAKPRDFEYWKQLDKKVQRSEEEYKNIIKIITKKKNKALNILTEVGLSTKGKAYIEKQIKKIESDIKKHL